MLIWYSTCGMPSIMKGALHAKLYKLFTFIPAQATFAYCVIPFSWGGATPSQINSLGSIQAHHLIWGSTSLSFSLSVQHSLTHSLVADRSMVVGHVLIDHMCSFMCASHIDMTAHNLAFLWVGSTLWTSCVLIWHEP